MSIPHRCPVCEGRGHVHAGFYDVPPGQSFSSGETANQTCSACNGTGLVWSNEIQTTFPSLAQPDPATDLDYCPVCYRPRYSAPLSGCAYFHFTYGSTSL